MKFKSFLKKYFLIVAFIFTAFLFIFTSPYAYAYEGINKEVKQYHYECDDIYYSDGYFAHSATEYDPHLATLSILMSKYSMNPGGPDNQNDTKWYNEQSNRVKGFFELIGFDSFLPNDDYKSRTSFSTIGVGCAKKKVGDYTVIGITVRSGGYFLEWANNVYLGDGTKSDYMHEGWYNAANKLISHLNKYIADYNITGKIKLWMAGFSRGGAVTNIAAGLLDNDINNNSFKAKNVSISHDDLYAYTFEAPQGANINSKTVKFPTDDIYNNIFNVVNPNDLVTKVAMKGYGFTRFGIDKFILTKLYDPAAYDNARSVYKKIYSESHNDINKYSADDFVVKGITGDKIAGLIAGTVAGGIAGGAITGVIIEKVKGFVSVDNTKANYDSNIVTNMFLDELVNNIGSRETYCKLYQEFTRDLMLTMMNDDKTDKKAQLMNLILNILLESYMRKFGIIGKSLLKLVYPNHSETAISNLVSLAAVVAKIYDERPNELISLITNIGNIFQNHDTDINVIHLECQDDYYINAYNKKHSDDQLSPVALLDNASLVHIAFYGYNDVQVYDLSGNKVVDVSGHVFGKSDVKSCNPNIAVGYYSYITEEKMELYLPVNTKYKVSFKSYSKKLRHSVIYETAVQYVTAHNTTATNDGNSKLPSGSTHAWFNSDRVDIHINVKP